MSFFSKLFGSKKQNNQTYNPTTNQKQQKSIEEPQKTGKPFFTNAPSHWPVVTDEFISSNTKFTNNFDEKKGEVIFDKRMFMVNSLVLLGAINEGLSKNTGTKILSSYSGGFFDSKEQFATTCCVEKLLYGGILKTNGIVIDNSEKYGVFLFERPTSMAYINELKKLFIEDGFKDVVYYALEDPNQVEQSGEITIPFESLNNSCFSLNSENQAKKDRNYKNYAVWWSENPEVRFLDSSAFTSLSRYYGECADSYSYILGKLGFALGINKDDNRIAIPDYDEVLLKGPEDAEIIMTLSTDTGINFHFPTEPKFERYRDNFLKVFSDFTHSIKQQVIENNFERDATPIHPKWFENVRSHPGEAKEISSINFILSDKVPPILN